MHRQVPVIQKAQRTVDVPLLQHIDTTVDVSVAKQHKDCMTKHDEIERDNKLRSAQFRTESKKQIVFDSEGPSDMRFGIRCKQGSRVVRCVTLTTPAGRLFADEAHVCFLEVPQRHSTGAGRAHRGAQHRPMKLAPHERVISKRITDRLVDVPGCEAAPSIAHPDSAKDVGSSSSAALG